MPELNDINHIKPIESLILQRIDEIKRKEDNLEATILELQRERAQLEYSLNWLKENTVPSPIVGKEQNFTVSETAPEGYKAIWTWETKIKFIIEFHEILGDLTTSEIVNYIMEYEPDRYERAKVVASVSAVLSQKTKDGGVFKKRYNERNEYIYSINRNDDLPF